MPGLKTDVEYERFLVGNRVKRVYAYRDDLHASNSLHKSAKSLPEQKVHFHVTCSAQKGLLSELSSLSLSSDELTT